AVLRVRRIDEPGGRIGDRHERVRPDLEIEEEAPGEVKLFRPRQASIEAAALVLGAEHADHAQLAPPGTQDAAPAVAAAEPALVQLLGDDDAALAFPLPRSAVLEPCSETRKQP